MIKGVSRKAFVRSSGTYNVYALELATSGEKRAKGLSVTVHFLDDTEHDFFVAKRAKGSVLLEQVYSYLDLVEKDYFGLQFGDNGAPLCTNNKAHQSCMRWLDPSKIIKKQLGNNKINLYFKVKFYVSDPSKLLQEYTRYQFYLQIKQDIIQGKLVLPLSTAILLASFMVQAEIGDYQPDEHDYDYISNLQLIPEQNKELELKISELHKLHKGKTPADAEFHFLDYAKRLDLYGVELHKALDNANKHLQLGVTHSGLVVFHNNIKFNTFSWSKISKISFKRRQFFIQLLREPSENYDTILIFNLESYRSCKTLWKSCVEHHTFFRLDSPKMKRKFPLSLGSKFTYSGRTEYQTVSEVQQKNKHERKFVRSPSRVLNKHAAQQAQVSGSSEEKIKVATPSLKATRAFDNKVTSMGPKEPRKAWVENQTSDDDASFLDKTLEGPFSPGIAGRVLSYADDEIPSPNSNGVFDTPPYSVSQSPVSQIIEETPNVTITLYPDTDTKYGFNIKGGTKKSDPIIVMKVASFTPADKCTPKLSEGDQILSINGVDVTNSTYDDAVKLIQDARGVNGGKLTLVVKPNYLNTIYSGIEEYSEAPYQFVPLGDVQDESKNALGQSMLLLEDGLATGLLVDRYESLFRKHPDLNCNESLKPKNINKNRYRDILPYDTTRVLLKNATSGSDYINANFVNMSINGTNITNKYIATQGPLPTTSDDFWQMILEESCTLIVMLTTLLERGRTKCHKYWPDPGETMKMLNMNVKCVKEEKDTSGSFVYRDFILTDLKDNTERDIKHIQYVAWPDHGVPDSPSLFLEFVDRVRDSRNNDAPVVVHCSAGIGRTGVLVLMETALCLIEANEPVYPLEIVKNMRMQRAMMIQNASQYKFVCESVYAAYLKKMESLKEKEELEEEEEEKSE